MPALLKHIDYIARVKKRDVLYVHFGRPDVYYEDLTVRQDLLAWLNENGIGWMPCSHFASENGFASYKGQLYIDLPFDASNPKYQLLEKHLENEDGSSRIPGVYFMYVPLEEAMKNAHHDEPGFWEKWAEEF